ncbi:MAG: hypothetical protein ACK5MA_11370 [Parachlamydiaceae bacterium]
MLKYLLMALAGMAFLQELKADLNLHRKIVYVGPDWKHVKRTNSFQTKQHGHLMGVRYGFEWFKRYGWYIGAEGYWGSGSLSGHSGSGVSLHSKFFQEWYEGRFGYTFQSKEGWQPSITPFAGYGWLKEKNNFTSPSPIHAHFKTEYSFASFGTILSCYPTCDLQWRLNLEVRYPLSPKCYISHDREMDPSKQRINERLQYFVEMPLVWRMNSIAFGAVPFYNSIIYGSHPNYPFNYIKTRFEYWGCFLNIQYQW